MSTESSASETTPLRRPESQLSDDVNLNVTPLETRNAPINHLNSTAPTTFSNRNQQSQHQHQQQTAPTTAIANHNNNNIEVRLGNIFSHNFNNNLNSLNNQNSNHNSNTNRQNNDSDITKMDTNKRILCRVALDVLILLCVGFPILCFFIWGSAYERGFFCDDESLKHPFKDSTVRNWMLYIIGLIIPVGVIFAVEIIISKSNAKRSNGNNTMRRYVFMDHEIPDWMIECYKKIGVFGFGAAVCQLTTDIAKYSIGRLRPHFFAVCQPIMADGTTCNDPSNFGKYIQDFTCLGENSTARMLKEIRLSFPSGHSSFTFFTMVYMALYLQSRMTWRGSKLLRHFLQFLFIMTAWYTALSRVSDYKHHWSDVLAGSVIGTIVAVIVAKYISDLFQQTPTKSYFLPRTTQDANTTLPPPTINGGHHL